MNGEFYFNYQDLYNGVPSDVNDIIKKICLT